MSSSQPTLALGLAPPAPAGTCPSCGRPINHRCGPCESAAPNPWQQRQSYVAWTGDCARTAMAWAEGAGVARTADRYDAIWAWLLEETPIADPELALQADILLGNLEDAIPADRKVAAREGLVTIGREVDFQGTPLWTRVNSLDSPWFLDDVTQLVEGIGSTRSASAGDSAATVRPSCFTIISAMPIGGLAAKVKPDFNGNAPPALAKMIRLLPKSKAK